ncbi:MAG: ATP-binding protein [Acetobacteraceae bacterium]|nr:ATP-binding protein [Acetobacteraceae bacterium]
MIKLVLFGHTGSGKSTSARLAQEFFRSRGLSVAVLKLAEPLYELQGRFYELAGRPIDHYAQDQVLLEMIAAQLRRISPTSLVDHFLARLERTQADVVINDDLRDFETDYRALKAHGFRFIRVRCCEEVRLRRLGMRRDLTVEAHSATTAQIDLIEPDFVVDNSTDDVEELRRTLSGVLERLL